MITMELTEVFIFNRALDGKDIYSLPSFDTLNMSEMLIGVLKDSLVKQGFLKNPNELTSEGARIVERISKFKNAKKYVRIDNMVMGIMSDGFCILLQKSYFDDDYDFFVIDISNGAEQLLESYDFLKRQYAEDLQKEIEISYEELVKEFEIKAADSFEFVTIDNVQKKNKTDEIVFSSRDRLYIYERTKKLLFSKTSVEIQKILNERMAV